VLRYALSCFLDSLRVWVRADETGFWKAEREGDRRQTAAWTKIENPIVYLWCERNNKRLLPTIVADHRDEKKVIERL
jgi:hypothetical protein